MQEYTIYRLINKLEPEKCYVGNTKNLTNRIYQHRTCVKHIKKNKSTKIHHIIKELGWSNFEKEILWIGYDLYLANYFEEYFIKKYNCVNIGYNLQGGGKGKYYISEESREKRINSHLGYKKTEEERKKCTFIKNPPFGINNINAKLDDDKVFKMIKMYKSGVSIHQLMDIFGLKQAQTYNICMGFAWKHVWKKFNYKND